MRIFTAIPVPKAAQDAFLDAARGKLPIPYINAENFHVTLNFFGDLDTDQSARAIAAWTNGLPSFRRFSMEPDKVDKFGNLLVIRMRPNPALMEMQATLQAHFRAQGLSLDGVESREYVPHVTLGKMHLDNVMFRNRKVGDFPNEALAAMSFVPDRIVLYESKLLLHHHHYVPLSEHQLK